MRWLARWCWPLPSFGWENLAFADRLKLVAFFIQAGAGVAMTGFAFYAMLTLSRLKAIWPVFYLGAAAMLIIGVVITGLAGLLIKRNVEAEVGMFRFKSQDNETAQQLMSQAPTVTTQQVSTPAGQPDVTTTTVQPPNNGSA